MGRDTAARGTVARQTVAHRTTARDAAARGVTAHDCATATVRYAGPTVCHAAEGKPQHRSAPASARTALAALVLTAAAGLACIPGTAGAGSFNPETAVLFWRIEAIGYWRGFRIGKARGQLMVDDKDYRIRLSAGTTGLVDIFARWNYSLEAEGSFAAPDSPELRPSRYEAVRIRRRSTRTRTIDFESGLARVAESDRVLPPDPARPGKTVPQLPEAQRRGVVDPGGAVLSIGRALARVKSCPSRIRMFDGKRRNDVLLTDDGEEILDLLAVEPEVETENGETETGSSPETAQEDDVATGPENGPARRCSFFFERVAGFSEEGRERPPITGAIWFRDGGDPRMLMPVQIALQTWHGRVVIRIRTEKYRPG